MFLLGRKSLSLAPCSFWGVSVQGQRPPGQRTPPGQKPHWTETSFLGRGPPCTAKSWWYASYWNTFLFFKYFTEYFLNKLKFSPCLVKQKQFKLLQPKLSLVSVATILQTAKFLSRRNLDLRHFLESKWLIIWLLG